MEGRCVLFSESMHSSLILQILVHWLVCESRSSCRKRGGPKWVEQVVKTSRYLIPPLPGERGLESLLRGGGIPTRPSWTTSLGYVYMHVVTSLWLNGLVCCHHCCLHTNVQTILLSPVKAVRWYVMAVDLMMISAPSLSWHSFKPWGYDMEGCGW